MIGSSEIKHKRWKEQWSFKSKAWVLGLTLLDLSCENWGQLTLLSHTQETLLVWTCYNSMIQ